MTSCYHFISLLSQEYAAASRANATASSSRESQDEIPEGRPRKSREKVASNPLEPTTTGALLLQSMLRLHAPHNGLVLDRCAQGRRPDAPQL